MLLRIFKENRTVSPYGTRRLALTRNEPLSFDKKALKLSILDEKAKRYQNIGAFLYHINNMLAFRKYYFDINWIELV